MTRREPDALTGTVELVDWRLPAVQRLDASRAEPGHLNLRALSMQDGRVEGLEVESFEILPVHHAVEMATAVAVVLSAELGVNTSGYLALSEVARRIPPQLVLVAGGDR